VLVYVLVVVATVLVFSVTPLKHFADAIMGNVDEAYVTYRLLSERDALISDNQRLREELASFQASASSGGAFEASVRAQLEELQGIIMGAHTQNVVTGRSTGTSAKNGKREGEDLAASIKKQTNRAHKNTLKDTLDALGGSEVDCTQDPGNEVCAPKVRKQNVSMTSTDSPLRRLKLTKAPEFLSPTQQDVNARLQATAAMLRVLPMGYPVEGRVTSGFGFRRSPFSRKLSFHEGLDISLPKGGDVFATGAGVVSKVSYERAYGWMVDVAHTKGVVTRYAHLSKTLVKVGQRVERGDRIALSGNTGRSTGPHLHYEVRVKDRPRDPKAFVLLPQKLAKVI
jgi:murein DD-endopeptidase MepM/ murein hydrolase activator NlpD